MGVTGRAIAIALGLVLSPGIAVAGPDEPFDGYADLCGYEIERRSTPRMSQAYIDASGRRLIVLDTTLDEPRQEAHRLFLIAHECAHHRMDHTTRAGLARRMTQRHGIRDQELSADCWAAEILTQLGMHKQLRRLADEFWRRGFVSPGQGYPSGIQRSNVLRHCAANVRAKMDKAHASRGFAATPDHHP